MISNYDRIIWVKVNGWIVDYLIVGHPITAYCVTILPSL